jgi:methionyl-tRNA formyltransferase
MKVVFLGTPGLAVPSLIAISEHHDVVLVATQPDRPRGRGRKLGISAVREKAVDLGLECWQPESLGGDGAVERLRSTGADILAVVAYGLKIPDALLGLAPHGAVNLHFSLLPAYRGAAPLNWAVIRGEKETGVTTFRLTSRMDTGPVYMRKSLPIELGVTAGELGSQLAEIGAGVFADTLNGIGNGSLTAGPQDEERATAAPKLKKSDGRIDWSRPALEIVNLIHGVNPWPGAYTTVGGKTLKVWRAAVAGTSNSGDAGPGSVVVASPRMGLVVAAGEGMVLLTEVQAEGKRRTRGRDYLAGHRLQEGSRFL